MLEAANADLVVTSLEEVDVVKALGTHRLACRAS
jgi:hypothetical protein